MPSLRVLLAVVIGWLDHRRREAVAYPIEENWILRGQLHGRRLKLSDDERRRLAVRGHWLGRQLLSQVATIVTPDTILCWHRLLVARQWTYATRSSGRARADPRLHRAFTMTSQ